MEKINISVSIVSVPGAVIKEDFPVDQSRKLARKLNEYGYNLTLQYPNRFRFFATLTLPDVEGSVGEAIYALDMLGAAGIMLLASSSGVILGSERFDPLYTVLNDRSAVVFVHPTTSMCTGEDELSSSNGLPAAGLEFLLDTTRAAANLVYKNVTRRYPNIKFLFSHSGGFLPFVPVAFFQV